MEPTMAPMMMLVTVIPETEEERGAGSVLNTCASLVSSITPTGGNSQATNSLRQDTAFSRRRAQGEEGRKEVGKNTLLPHLQPTSERSGGLSFRKVQQ